EHTVGGACDADTFDLFDQPIVGQTCPAKHRLVAADPEVASLVGPAAAECERVLVVDRPNAIRIDLAPGVGRLTADLVHARDVRLQQNRQASLAGHDLDRSLLAGA